MNIETHHNFLIVWNKIAIIISKIYGRNGKIDFRYTEETAYIDPDIYKTDFSGESE